jgi:hypothetical protein
MLSRSAAIVVSTILTGVLIAGSGVAHGAPPAECQSSRDLRGYAAGFQVGTYIVDSACQLALDDPDRFEEVQEELLEVVSTVLGATLIFPSQYAECRAVGTAHGIAAALESCQDDVGELCILDGWFWGALSSALYCELAVALDGLGSAGKLPRAPANFCGANFEATCDGTFAEQSKADYQCRPYTKGAHRFVFREAQHNMCAYEFDL